MTAIHSEIESIDDLEDKQVELLGGEQISAKEYLGRFGMTSEEALCVPYEEYDEEYKERIKRARRKTEEEWDMERDTVRTQYGTTEGHSTDN